MTTKPIRFVFVCTGNICRSPMAEAIVRHKVKQQGLIDTIEVDSAAITRYHIGEKPDSRVIDVLDEEGISAEGITARYIQPADFYDADYLFAMDHTHKAFLEEKRPSDASATIELFLPFVGFQKRLDVPDPYYDTFDAFESLFKLLDKSTDELLASVCVPA